MALKTYRPTSPGLRQLVIVDRKGLWKGAPVKMLTEGKSKTGWTQCAWPYYDAAYWRRSQADLPSYRLQAPQV